MTKTKLREVRLAAAAGALLALGAAAAAEESFEAAALRGLYSLRQARSEVSIEGAAPALAAQADERTSVSDRPSSLNRVKLIVGDAAFVEEALAFIARQKEEILLSNFHVTDEGPGARVVAALADRARQGVRVRVLTDKTDNMRAKSFAMRRYRRAEAAQALREAEVEVREFRGDLFGQAKHNHNKVLLGDGLEALVGGSNIYQHLNKDYDLLVSGPLVAQLRRQMETDWHYSGPEAAKAPPAVSDRSPAEPQAGAADSARLKLYVSNNFEASIRPRAMGLVREARRSLDLSMMLICDLGKGDFLKELLAARARGVRIRILTDAHEELKTFTYHKALNGPTVDHLVQRGIPVRYYDAAKAGSHQQLHAKLMLVDGRVAFLGSSNLNSASFTQNNEIMLELSENEALLAALQEDFERDWDEHSFYEVQEKLSNSVFSKSIAGFTLPPGYKAPDSFVGPELMPGDEGYIQAQAQASELFKEYRFFMHQVSGEKTSQTWLEYQKHVLGKGN